MRAHLTVVSGCLLAMLAFHSAQANAQTTTQDATVVEARALFDEGMLHLREGRAAVGLDVLRRSLVLYPTVATRYNLGVALRLTGKTTEALATFQGLLREELESDQRTRVQEQVSKARTELATVRIRVTGVTEAALEIDGRKVAEVGANEVFTTEVDAGEHVLIAQGDGGSGRKAVQVERGGSLDTHLIVIPMKDQANEQRRRKRTRWLASAAAAAVTAVVLTAVLVTRDRTASPLVDPVTGNRVTLHGGREGRTARSNAQ